MFIPLHDANPLRHVSRQYVTLALIAANVVVYFMSLGAENISEVISYSIIPVTFNETHIRPDQFTAVPETMTLFTYAFLHGDLWHLGGNMLFLWVFGDNVEDAMGHVRFLAFYLLCAAGGGLLHIVMLSDSAVPLIGASGSVSGIVAAYLMLHPRVKIWVLALGRIPLRLPAFWVLGFWVLVQVVSLAISTDQEVAWWAHIGGLATGAVLVVFFRRGGVPLFDRNLAAAAQLERRP